MAKVKPKILDQELTNTYDVEWEDYLFSLEQNDWADYDEHPWAWYMEKSVRLGDGWYLVTISPNHKDVTVIYYLKSVDAKFKHSKNEFLIKDEKDAIMVALKYA